MFGGEGQIGSKVGGWAANRLVGPQRVDLGGNCDVWHWVLGADHYFGGAASARDCDHGGAVVALEG